MRHLPLIITLLAGMALIACDDAAAGGVHDPGPVTAGPSAMVPVQGPDPVSIPLDVATDPLAVLESDGIIIPAVPTLVSARLAVRNGNATALVQLGPRGGPWRTVAMAADPPLIPPLLVHPRDGDLVRVAAASALGAEILGGRGPRQTWITALPVPEAVRIDP